MIWEQEQLKTLDPRGPRGGLAERVPQAHLSAGSYVFASAPLKFLFRSRAVAVSSPETQLEFWLRDQTQARTVIFQKSSSMAVSTEFRESIKIPLKHILKHNPSLQQSVSWAKFDSLLNKCWAVCPLHMKSVSLNTGITLTMNEQNHVLRLLRNKETYINSKW